MRLAGDLGNQFEIGVVVQDDQLASLSYRGNQGIDERKRSMLAFLSKLSLDADRPMMVAVGDRHSLKRVKPSHDRLVIS